MLYIDDELPHIKNAKALHIKRMYCYINRKINGNNTDCGDGNCTICPGRTRAVKISRHLRQVLNQIDLKLLVEAQPAKLLQIHKKYNKLYNQSAARSRVKDQEAISRIFNYDWFCDNDLYNAYDLCKGLDISTCVYCNRLYIVTAFTEKKAPVIRPTLDHWFAKADYPLLAISFYNLIPSCSPCNSSVKHKARFTLDKHVHPYLDKNLTQQYTLRSFYDKTPGTFKIAVDTADRRIKSTLAAMQISDIYQHHQSELKDLDLLRRKYNKRYLKDLGKLLDNTLTEKDVYRLMFGVEYEEENFHKRPLSKLKKDILGIKIR